MILFYKNMFAKLKVFLQESGQELKKVNWPSRSETIRYTLFVIGLSLTLAAFLGLLDFVFVQLLEKFIVR
jgi:preprotein translocase subunit SecE